VTATLSVDPFGILRDGRPVEQYTLSSSGITVRVLPYGGIIQSILVPDRHGSLGDVVLGFDTLDEYVAGTHYIGAVIGRYANRIARGRFTLDGVEHVLPTNNGPNHLHGGPGGFHTVLWHVEPVAAPNVGVLLSYTSPAGEQGYPGTLEAKVQYELTKDRELIASYRATTDAPTIVNLTQHSYFDLSAGSAPNVLDHELEVFASRFTPVDATLIPTGELRSVDGTPFDFRNRTSIGARIDDAGGYDHNYALDRTVSLGARLTDPSSGRLLEVLTTEPGLQFYSGNFLEDGIRGKGGRRNGYRSAICLEPQHFPDSPNQRTFPSTVLRPGDVYRSQTVYRFGVAR
jgi:aldose 1-epimerase